MTNDKQKEFARKLPFVMDEAMRLGLYRTMHKLHDTVRELGWELAYLETHDLPVKEKQP